MGGGMYGSCLSQLEKKMALSSKQKLHTIGSQFRPYFASVISRYDLVICEVDVRDDYRCDHCHYYHDCILSHNNVSNRVSAVTRVVQVK